MKLDTLIDPDLLYATVGETVDDDRPWFTGDIFVDIEIPGVEESLAAIVIAHPCSMRGKAGSLRKRILLSAVHKHDKLSEQKWADGYFNKMPLPNLPIQGDYHAADFDQIAPAETSQLSDAKRIACLSHDGINHLQQRLIHHLTRLEVKIGDLHKAFSHTYCEADLLEEWIKQLKKICENPTAKFEEWIRQENRQNRLKNEEERPLIRAAIREEIKRLRKEHSIDQDKM